MSKEQYVQLEAVRTALEKVVKDETEIEEILSLLSGSTVVVDETTVVGAEDPGVEGSDGVEGESGTPKVKQEYVILVSDPNGIVTKDLTGWVLQIPEGEDCREVVEKIKKSAYNFNASKKGQKYPVSSIGQAIEAVPNKFFKPQDVKIKSKEAVYVVTTDNKLPRS